MTKTKILIVDDRPENINALANLIAADDIEVLSATDAEGALGLLISNDFALALLDVQMPDTSGFELARLIRGVKKFKDLPVIFVTASAQEQSVIFEGYESGAVDLLFKPLDPHVVRSKVRVFVKLDQQSKALQKQMLELEVLKEAADAANSAKTQFLANMSHEIRTPLAGVLGFADALTRPGLTDSERQEYVNSIRRNGELLLRLIDDILDFSKIESQKIDFENIRFDLNGLIQDVQATLQIKAKQQKIDLQFVGPGKLDTQFMSDPIRVKQVLLNIVGNAIKFTRDGFVKVNCDVQAIKSMPNKRKVVFTVEDSGVGLTPIQVERLFHPFSQGDSSTRRKFGGTGLGLMISRHIANELGGDVELVSSVEKMGSTFRVSFIADVATQTKSTNEKREVLGAKTIPELKGKKILAVDDSPDNREIIEIFLKDTHAEVIEAGSAKDGIDLVRKFNPDLILMDIQMPEMDGYEATRKIRASGYKKPIIALTAHALKDEHERCHEVGCDYVLTKPISREKLITYVNRFLLH